MINMTMTCSMAFFQFFWMPHMNVSASISHSCEMLQLYKYTIDIEII